MKKKPRLEQFFKVFTNKGVKFYPLDNTLPEPPEDLEIYKIREIQGYGTRKNGHLKVKEIQ